MKTIKLSFIGLLCLIITIFFLKYAVISYNLIPMDFTTIQAPTTYNFGLTFTIQCIVLTAFALLSLANAITAFGLANKYYKKWVIIRRDNLLVKHIKEAKYNEVCDKLSTTNIVHIKEEIVEDYLKPKTSFGLVIQKILRSEEEQRLRKIKEDISPNNSANEDIFSAGTTDIEEKASK